MAPAPSNGGPSPRCSAIIPWPSPDPSSHLLCPVPGTIWLLHVHPHHHPTSQVHSKEDGSQKLCPCGLERTFRIFPIKGQEEQNTSEQQRTRLSISGVVLPAWPRIWDDLGKAHAFSLLSPCYMVTNAHANSIPRSGTRKSSPKGSRPVHAEPASRDPKKPGQTHPSSLSADPYPGIRPR